MAQLIDAETGNHVWAERYDRDVSQVFALQDEITTAIVTCDSPCRIGRRTAACFAQSN